MARFHEWAWGYVTARTVCGLTGATAVRDQRELLLLLRAEQNAFTTLCLEKGLFTMEEWDAALAKEADLLSKGMEERFPGFRATDVGLEMDLKVASETMKGWKP
ncbi:MAG TPA: hypothetical protein VFS67_21735 [Polyangiaceae bacterium]|nr:hypothetical protein [Polyangiaceae bacterium]